MVKSKQRAAAKGAPRTPTRNRALRVGYVPLCDCAPLVMAQELGLYAKRGLRVELSREVGWATIRDKIIYGELEAAQAVPGMIFAASAGVGSVYADCLTGLVLNLHGNAITLSEQLWHEGVRDGRTFAEHVRRRGNIGRRSVLGVVSPYSSHNFLLREWLIRYGLDPTRDVELVVVPPPQVYFNFQSGYLDGYCAGEPWNALSILARVGWVVATSADLSPLHPEKVLMVRSDFAEARGEEHRELIAALIEACAYCDAPENRERIMETLAEPQWLGTPIQALRMSMAGTFDFGHDRVQKMSDFNIFHRGKANVPTPERAGWVLGQMEAHGLLPDLSTEERTGMASRFRLDLYQAAAATLPPQVMHGQSPRHTIRV